MLGGRRSGADKYPFLPCCDPRFEWQLGEMDYAQWYGHVFSRGGGVPRRVKPVTVRMFYYVSDVEASLGMKRVSRGSLSSLCLDHRAWELRVVKLRVEVVNFR